MENIKRAKFKLTDTEDHAMDRSTAVVATDYGANKG